MISDVLADAVTKMDEYLNDPLYHAVYAGQMREELMALRTMMDSARMRLDKPPTKTHEQGKG